jgi:hypothetical protein
VARMISAWGCRVVPESYDQACTTEAPGGGAVGPVGDGALAPEEEGDARAFSRGATVERLRRMMDAPNLGPAWVSAIIVTFAQ